MAKRAPRPISKRQIALLQVARSKLGLEEDEWRALLIRVGGTNSARQLDERGFEAVLAVCERLGFTPFGAVGPYYGERPGMASWRQVQMIRDMWMRYKGGVFEEAALDGWLRAKFGVSSLRFATAETAGKAITALRHMTDRRKTA